MSYAIVRNEKLIRAKSQGVCVHNDRKAKNHSNKEIDISKSNLNYYLKKNELNYVKEFDRVKKEYALKGQIKSTSIIICEMIFTSDKEFFDNIGLEKTKQYFEESYKFICNYKNLGKQYVLSAAVHLDEGTPYMHLAYIPVIHTKDKEGNPIDKICCRDFWKGRNSYRDLQNAFYEHITAKGFELERGLHSEETGRKHENMQNYKQITNFENTKKVLRNIKLQLPQTPDLKTFRKVMLNRDEKIINEIIKPKDNLIEKLYKDNINLNTELSKQIKVVDEASNYLKEKYNLLSENRELHSKCIELERSHRMEINNTEYFYQKEIKKLNKEIKFLEKVIDKFKVTVKKFIHWVCNKFAVASEDDFIRKFERETGNSFNVDKQFNYEQFQAKEKEDEMEL